MIEILIDIIKFILIIVIGLCHVVGMGNKMKSPVFKLFEEYEDRGIVIHPPNY